MAYLDFLSSVHRSTKRDYLGRVKEFPKAEAAAVARKFDREYWDGDRKFGYGGYRYDGRWRSVAENIARHYQLKPGQKILDVGCGKGFLLYEFTQVVPGISVAGIDISAYAVNNAKEEIRQYIQIGNASQLPFADHSFDLIISVTTLHNLKCYDLEKALTEIERVGRQNKYIVVESFRNLREWANLLYWQLTCECFFWPDEWEWWFKRCGYTGDHSFIYFE